MGVPKLTEEQRLLNAERRRKINRERNKERYDNDDDYKTKQMEQKKRYYHNLDQDKKIALKRKQYLKNVNVGMIKNPKQKTLEKYNIVFNTEKGEYE